MRSTKELEKYIRNEISSRCNSVNWDKINFKEGSKNSVEGIYVFSENSKYHFLFTEKGDVREELITVEEEDVLWKVLDIFSFDLAMQYAIENREEGKDFRHLLFEKEIEICSLFGEKFKQKKILRLKKFCRKIHITIFTND